jgi:XTP/dITP diphosphohydrolase
MIGRLVLASNNEGKLREFRRLLTPLGIDVLPQSDLGIPEAAEPHVTFVENALAKARHASAAAGLPALADDSGVCVAALAGAPGVQSARYRCAMVFMRWPLDPAPIVRQASWEGRIARLPRGTGGFGYDPLFLVGDGNVTAAELEAAHKNSISHRGKALRALLTALTEPGEGA